MFKQLLVPLDRSPLAEQAIGQAAAIARASRAKLDLVLVHEPLPFAGFGDAPWNADQWNDEHKYLDSILGEVLSGATIPVSNAVMRGAAVEMICQRARDIEADLIVMTSHGRTGVSRAWIGSIADGVMRRSGTPVLLLRPIEGKTRREAAHHLFKRILVPLDGSALASKILSTASALARTGGGRIVPLRVVQPVPMIVLDAGMPFAYPRPLQDDVTTERLVNEAKEELAEVARRLGSDGLEKAEPHVIVGPHVAQAIVDFARTHEIDVIAMSTHGRGASRLLIGSVADKVLRASGLPMLMHRPISVADTGTEPHSNVVADGASSLAHL